MAVCAVERSTACAEFPEWEADPRDTTAELCGWDKLDESGQSITSWYCITVGLFQEDFCGRKLTHSAGRRAGRRGWHCGLEISMPLVQWPG
jgi:hypothetical protein